MASVPDGYHFSEQEDYVGLQRLRAELDASLLRLRLAGNQLAENQAAYKVAAADLTTRMRARGETATSTKVIVDGDPHVAELRLRRDCAQVNYDTEREVINAIKKNIDVVREQMGREWSSVPITQQ